MALDASKKSIWVVPEPGLQSDKIDPLNAGLLSQARRIANKVGGTVTALLFSDRTFDPAPLLAPLGPDRIYSFKHDYFQSFNADAYAEAVKGLLIEELPWLILAANTLVGMELLPILANYLGTGLVANCLKIDLSEPSKLLFSVPAFGGQVYQEVVFEPGRTQLVAMDSRFLTPGILGPHPAPVVRHIEPALSNVGKIFLLGFVPADFHTLDVSEAAVVVSAGAGAMGDEVMPLVKELAEVLKGSLGATRPVTDEGSTEKTRLIGQTGKSVSPELYLALGISGAPQHVSGIQESGSIVSINCDPGAPIFQLSDAGAVADLKEILPQLITRLKVLKECGQTKGKPGQEAKV